MHISVIQTAGRYSRKKHPEMLQMQEKYLEMLQLTFEGVVSPSKGLQDVF